MCVINPKTAECKLVVFRDVGGPWPFYYKKTPCVSVGLLFLASADTPAYCSCTQWYLAHPYALDR